MSTSFITPGHVRAFQAVTTQLYGEGNAHELPD
jgi:hypothetical protein